MEKVKTIQQFAEENPDKVHVVDSEKLEKANENIKNAIKGKNKEKENKWKPSEEQMGALNEWLKNHQYDRDSRYYYPIFQSLYNDLKTL